MHVSNLVSAVLLVTPALAAPLPSCESILSFTQSSKYSIKRIRSFCSSPFSSSTKLHRRAISELDLPKTQAARLSDEEYVQQASWLPELHQQERLSTSVSAPPPVTVSARRHPAPSDQPARQIVHTKKQGNAPSCKYSVGYFKRRTHGLFLAFLSMSEDLAISGAVAVMVVLAILVAADRVLRAKARAARYE